MPWKTPNPGSEWANGENPEPVGGESEPARAWMHPSELGARVDCVPSQTPMTQTHLTSTSIGNTQCNAKSGAGFTRRVALSAIPLSIALSIAFGAIALERSALERSASGSRGESRAESRTGPPDDFIDARGHTQGDAQGIKASSIAAIQIRQGEQVATISGICVKGGIVTAAGSVSQVGMQITASIDATPHAVSISSVDEVSSLAYLTGYLCPNAELSMEKIERWRSGQPMLMAAGPHTQNLSTPSSARVLREGGVVANTQFGRTGDAILLPIFKARSKHLGHILGQVIDSSAIGTALVNSNGEFMGVIIAKVNGSYLAIPSAMALRVIGQFTRGEKVEGGWLGLELDTDGEVLGVSPNSPAQRAGILQGETIYATDGVRTAGLETLLASLQAHAPGDRLPLTIEYQGRTREVIAILGSRPNN